ncbi:hypothetical protein [Rickettsia endosymbiont of Ceutorhynchus obstrictus]
MPQPLRGFAMTSFLLIFEPCNNAAAVSGVAIQVIPNVMRDLN